MSSSAFFPCVPPPGDVVPCKACSSSGIYVDYADPGVVGGIATACKECGGRGWVNRLAASARDELGKEKKG